MKPRPTTHCKRGHDLTGDNLYVSPDGSRRYCRVCQYESRGRRDVTSIRIRREKKNTHCKRGHELTPDNIIPDRDGSRRCRTCKRIARENMTDEKRAAIAKKKAEYFKRNFTTGRMVGTLHASDILAGRPSEFLLMEARRRAAAPHRDLTGMILGDPKKGQSALDLANRPIQ